MTGRIVLVTTRALATHAAVFIMLGGIQIVATSLICYYSKRYEHSYCAFHQPVGLRSRPLE